MLDRLGGAAVSPTEREPSKGEPGECPMYGKTSRTDVRGDRRRGGIVSLGCLVFLEVF
jgi:hypothetical protein